MLCRARQGLCSSFYGFQKQRQRGEPVGKQAENKGMVSAEACLSQQTLSSDVRCHRHWCCLQQSLLLCVSCAAWKKTWEQVCLPPLKQECFTVQGCYSFLGKQGFVFCSWALEPQREGGHTGCSWGCQTHACLVQSNTRLLHLSPFSVQRQTRGKGSPRAIFRTDWETLRIFAELNAFQGAVFQCIVVVNV